VLLIPGVEYACDRPLLRSAGDVFRGHGWAVHEFRWSAEPPLQAGQDIAVWFEQLRTFVADQMTRAPETTALVGKSMGAFAAARAADLGLPGIWLTPPLRDSAIADDLRRSAAPYLLVGSRADPSWQHLEADHLVEVADADHNLEVPGDPARSAELLRDVTGAMDKFVRGLG